MGHADSPGPDGSQQMLSIVLVTGCAMTLRLCMPAWHQHAETLERYVAVHPYHRIYPKAQKIRYWEGR